MKIESMFQVLREMLDSSGLVYKQWERSQYIDSYMNPSISFQEFLQIFRSFVELSVESDIDKLELLVGVDNSSGIDIFKIWFLRWAAVKLDDNNYHVENLRCSFSFNVIPEQYSSFISDSRLLFLTKESASFFSYVESLETLQTFIKEIKPLNLTIYQTIWGSSLELSHFSGTEKQGSEKQGSGLAMKHLRLTAGSSRRPGSGGGIRIIGDRPRSL